MYPRSCSLAASSDLPAARHVEYIKPSKAAGEKGSAQQKLRRTSAVKTDADNEPDSVAVGLSGSALGPFRIVQGSELAHVLLKPEAHIDVTFQLTVRISCFLAVP